MVTSISKIMKILDQLAPFETAESWDNVGMIIGNPSKQTTRIMLALDLSDDVISEAIEESIDLIITHHPPIFKGLKHVTTEDPVGRKVIQCIENDIAVISAHTNLDKSGEHGINQAIGEAFELESTTLLVPEVEGVGFGVVGKLPEPISLDAFIHLTKQIFEIETLKITDYQPKEKVQRIAVSSGASADFISDAINAKADVFILGDLKYHEAQQVENTDLVLIDVGHYESEVFYLQKLKEKLDMQIMSQGYDVMTMVSEQSKPVLYTV
ncbi:Nif3-like dinuclear metal center hexameric protein [Fusibacter paucivorans]|uniref:GTP cyclohydrolase 1 type 2 homolog n=1 Tax=Fusibacter paucivorans TaxID=76009 RepID=A0ABS5PQ73_9FIRM|nr:Nif3-like dinuclear metal center hexameric protein [Fusibacter paucivorans]MBS7526741.1 Nif3-like dinuclear metal center hexameric protein [Fusibacter paucivorans]